MMMRRCVGGQGKQRVSKHENKQVLILPTFNVADEDGDLTSE